MSAICKVCLKPVRGATDYHPRCLRTLFGTATAPRFELEVSKFHTAALAMVGHTSLSGVQKKISVSLSADRKTLQVATAGGRYILKPQTEAYPALPENEHLTTRLATLVDIEVADSGLVSLEDNSLAFIVRRFDRPTEGGKLRQEDFCQLAEKSPKEKYDGSAEMCVRLLRQFASEPLVEILKLYRLLVFAWWTGNGDLHLKNLSVLTNREGLVCLTPAYDLVATRLVIPGDTLALPIVGKKDRLNRDAWLDFAQYCQLPEKTAVRVLSRQVAAFQAATALVDNSFLPPDQQEEYKQLITARSASLQ